MAKKKSGLKIEYDLHSDKRIFDWNESPENKKLFTILTS